MQPMEGLKKRIEESNILETPELRELDLQLYLQSINKDLKSVKVPHGKGLIKGIKCT